MSTPSIRFAVPPSMGHARASESAASLHPFLAELLGDLVSTEVYVADSYPALSLDLIHGHCDLAWGPPSVCARAEVHGARVLAQSLRAGAARYRSAIVARRGFTFDAANAAADAASLRAAWVDADSTGGYLLACAWLHSAGIDPRRGLRRQRFYGSYRAAVTAVLDEEADITAVFATAEDSTARRTALDEFTDIRAGALDVVAFTAETPNDGLAARPKLDESLARQITERFTSAAEDPKLREQLHAIFGVDGFVPAGAGAYSALHGIVTNSFA